jgi:hypothetical protein
MAPEMYHELARPDPITGNSPREILEKLDLGRVASELRV